MTFFAAKNIAKRYGSVVAIQEATLEIRQGEIRAILGGNGSGKSTLAKIIGGAVFPDAGEIIFEGKPYRAASPAQAKQQKVIFTSQELSLLTNLTVEENLVLPSIPTKGKLFTNRKEMRKQALQVLERVGLAHIAQVPVEYLPENQKFMVEFCKALLQQPKLLIIDEITSALFREEVEIFKQIVKELSRQGTGILFISHRMSEIFSLCDSVTVMRNGQVIGTYGIADVNEDMLVEMLTGTKAKSAVKPAVEHIEVADKILLSVKDMPLPTFGTRISLDVKHGEMIGVAGLQGQGQSDFVRTLFGMMGPVHFRLDGKEVQIHSVRKSVKEGLAFLSGDREREGTFSIRSISENLEAVNTGALRRKPLNQNKLLEAYGVKFDSVRQPIRTLSGGNQQKVVIARWTGAKPKVLLADDPTKGIDVQARRDVHSIFSELTAGGSAVIMVSSDDEELVNLTKGHPNARVLVMYGGQIMHTLRGDDITVHNIISASLPREGVENR